MISADEEETPLPPRPATAIGFLAREKASATSSICFALSPVMAATFSAYTCRRPPSSRRRRRARPFFFKIIGDAQRQDQFGAGLYRKPLVGHGGRPRADRVRLDEFRALLLPFDERLVHGAGGAPAFQEPGAEAQYIVSVVEIVINISAEGRPVSGYSVKARNRRCRFRRP